MDALIEKSPPSQYEEEYDHVMESDQYDIKETELRKSRRNISRGPNFTLKEQRLLEKLVKVYGDQINNKCTKLTSVALKNRAWEELTKDFNAHMGGEVYRTAHALRKRYDNYKQIKKGKRDSRKKEDESNRDNSRQISDYSENENYVAEPENYVEASMKLRESDEDEDADNEEEGKGVKELIRVHITGGPKVENNVDDENEDCVDRTSFKINANNFQHGTPFPQNSPSCNLDTNSSLVESKKHCLLQEHKLRLNQIREKHDFELSILRRQMQEKHELELKVIRLEHSEKLKIMREEHFKRMKLLDLEGSVGIINKI